jgi:hypothetical protein
MISDAETIFGCSDEEGVNPLLGYVQGEYYRSIIGISRDEKSAEEPFPGEGNKGSPSQAISLNAQWKRRVIRVPQSLGGGRNFEQSPEAGETFRRHQAFRQLHHKPISTNFGITGALRVTSNIPFSTSAHGASHLTTSDAGLIHTLSIPLSVFLVPRTQSFSQTWLLTQLTTTPWASQLLPQS